MPNDFLRDVLRGLSRTQKELPCKYFYDAVGSRLFDRICDLDEYYLTRCELEILRTHGSAIADAVGPGCALIEFGSGSGLKTRLLLERLSRPAAYVPVDISGEHLLAAAARLRDRFPGLPVLPTVADFTRPFPLPPVEGRRVVYFSGSTVGNFAPPEAAALLAGIRKLADGLLIGVDLQKDAAILEPAYDDAKGVTAAFNLNILARINRELGADFDLDRFRHRAVYDAARGRIEMRLVSQAAQTVRLGNAAIVFREGEAIVTEHSHKYTPDGFAALARRGGWAVRHVWTDARGLYSVQYLEPHSTTR